MIPPTLELLARPVAAFVSRYGMPTSVSTRDDGQRFTFAQADGTVAALVDDDAAVHAFEMTLPPGSTYTLTVDGKPHRLTFGVTTSIAVRDELAADAENDGAGFRVFRADVHTYAAFFFDRDGKLTRLVAGDRGAFVRLGYLSDPTPVQARFPFTAPALRRTEVADGAGSRATVLRLDVDRFGVVRKVAVILPGEDAAYDAELVRKLGADRYAPAKLGGRAIGASVFREIRR